MFSAEQIYECLEARRIELGLTHVELGKRVTGKDDPSLLHNIKRGSSPSVERLKSLSDALGLEMYFGPERKTVPATPVRGMAEAPALIEHERQRLVVIGLIRKPRSRKKGRLDKIAVPEGWLAAKGILLQHAGLVEISDDHLEPRYEPGSIALVNRISQVVTRHALYAIQRGGAAPVVRRLEQLPSGMLLISGDNPSYQTELIEPAQREEVKVLGSVAWIGAAP